MKLLALTHEIAATGASVLLVEVLALALARGWAVDVLAPAHGAQALALQAAGARFVRQADPAAYDRALVSTLVDVQRVLELGARLPVVFWVHEGLTLRALGDPSMPLWSRAFQLASRVVFNTAWQARTVFAPYLAGVDPTRLAVVTPGPSRAVSEAAGPDVVPMQGRRRHVLWVGSMYPRKRPEDLVQAMLRLGDTRAHCDFVGNTDHLASLDASTREILASRSDLFTVHGEVSQPRLADFLRQSRLLCHPSGDETFGMAPMEAALFGMPLALSALPCYEGIWNHGHSCLFHPPGAIDLLAWHLRALLSDNAMAQRLADAARRTAQRHAQRDRAAEMLAIVAAAHT